jgi:AcrR family transcriptional regulator
MARAAARQASAPTRDRILKAASKRFSKRSYEEVGLRDIAADVGIDVAYVHRSFGSKEQLFFEALTTIVEAERIVDRNNLAGSIAKVTWAPKDSQSSMSVNMVAHSLGSPGARRVIRNFLQHNMIKSLSQEVEDPTEPRAALIAAFLYGVSIFKNVLQLKSVAQGKDMERIVEDVVRQIMTAPMGK